MYFDIPNLVRGLQITLSCRIDGCVKCVCVELVERIPTDFWLDGMNLAFLLGRFGVMLVLLLLFLFRPGIETSVLLLFLRLLFLRQRDFFPLDLCVSYGSFSTLGYLLSNALELFSILDEIPTVFK